MTPEHFGSASIDLIFSQSDERTPGIETTFHAPLHEQASGKPSATQLTETAPQNPHSKMAGLAGTSLLLRSDPRKLGEIIAQHTEVPREKIELAVKRCKTSGLALGEQLFQDGVITDDERARCLAIQWGMPFLDLARSRVPRTAIHLLDESYQKIHRILVVQLQNNVATLAMVDPLDVDIVDEIRLVTGYEIRPVMVSETALFKTLRHVFEGGFPTLQTPEGEVGEIVAIDQLVENELKESDLRVLDDMEDIDDFQKLIDHVPIVRLVDSILAQGIRKKASDIHFQPEPDCLQIRYRLDGILHDGPKLPKSLMKVVVARLKVMGQMDVASRREPQDGRVSLRADGKNFALRVSILPCIFGPKIVLRIAEQSGEMIGLKMLGLKDNIQNNLKELIHRPHGILLITGPTGSGKSTTLYSAVTELNDGARNILTVEDPVEMQFRGISQAEINEKGGLTFSSCLRAALRQDPDVIMVGEIRDEETASLASQASLTGHMVLSTLHTNDAPSAVTRMVEMKVQPFLVASALTGVLAQRLVRKVCNDCCRLYQPGKLELEAVGISTDQGIMLKDAVGCPSCNETGYKGRIGVFELLTVTPNIKLQILEEAGESAIREAAIADGMETLIDDVRRQVLEGATTLQEAHRVIHF